MPPASSSDIRSRAVAAVAAVSLQGLLGWAILNGLSGRIPHVVAADFKVFDIAPPVPPPVPTAVPVHHAARRAARAAVSPHARATPTPVAAPLPEVALPPPPDPVVAAPLPALGADPAAGAADAGQGTGAGGTGPGTGAGGTGTGSGGTPARLLRGAITGRDYPREAKEAGIEGDLTTRYLVDTHGRVARCYVTASSGSAVLDAATCRLVIARYRFAPARDAAGRPVEDTIFEDHGWRISADDER